MNAHTTIIPSARAHRLVAEAREIEGSRNAMSEGAIALAEVLVRDEHHPVIFLLGGWGGVKRLLADGYMPGNDIGEQIGHLTDGAVTPQAFRRPWGGDIPREASEVRRGSLPGFRALGQPLAVDEDAPVRSPGILSVMGIIGTVPPGALFRFADIDGEPNCRLIAGMGVGMGLSEPGIAALRDVCDAALADIRGGAAA